MKPALYFALCLAPFWAAAQVRTLRVQPVFSGETIALEKMLHSKGGDSLLVSTLRFYLGNFEFWENGRCVLRDKSWRLLDLEAESSLALAFDFAGNAQFDSLAFDLGTDSLTNVSGAMGGDLDPSRGMFWTWQSGYINLKLEGFFSPCPARGGLFEFHLGGFMPPFQTSRRVAIKVGRVKNTSNLQLSLDFAPLLRSVAWAKKTNMMSPCAEAARLMDVLAASFQVD